MRICGGHARGIILLSPKGTPLRPTTGALREAVFSAIASEIVGAQFLDLCAGIGSYGLEAISRGASGGTFVEKNRKFVPFLEKNLHNVARSTAVELDPFHIIACDMFTLRSTPRADVIFIDPPYGALRENQGLFISRVEELIASNGGSICIFEMPSDLFPKFSPSIICKNILGKMRGRDSPKALVLTGENE
ncbi:MAG: RsmD family RNA methyltransferase [Puniceicoccales bacterium]|jgi:16S rRNA (guanine966-N2)-methyltransferase|nr:RsmD family RNA methyltransferase [Puniceicoccales bacterium]